MAGDTDQTIPQWASDLRVSVAKIEAKTEQIPEIIRSLEELRANTVSMSEHLKLMSDVDELKKRDLSARSDWDDMLERVPVLWDERSQLRGSIRASRVLLAGIGLVVTVLTAVTLVHDLGVNISVRP